MTDDEIIERALRNEVKRLESRLAVWDRKIEAYYKVGTRLLECYERLRDIVAKPITKESAKALRDLEARQCEIKQDQKLDLVKANNAVFDIRHSLMVLSTELSRLEIRKRA